MTTGFRESELIIGGESIGHANQFVSNYLPALEGTEFHGQATDLVEKLTGEDEIALAGDEIEVIQGLAVALRTSTQGVIADREAHAALAITIWVAAEGAWTGSLNDILYKVGQPHKWGFIVGDVIFSRLSEEAAARRNEEFSISGGAPRLSFFERSLAKLGLRNS